MSEDPQFRTVLRGLDPDQVKAALEDLQTSVVTARRLAADRTIELTRSQERVTQLQRELEASGRRVTALKQEVEAKGLQGAPTAGDVGARIASMLALANEEAAELRAKGRDEAQRHLDAADSAIAESRAEMSAYADGVRSEAHTEARQIVDAARRDASELLSRAGRDAETLRAEAEAAAAAHHGQAEAVAAFGQQVGLLAERLQLAQARVEQLAKDEATLVERQGRESAERIRRDVENQLAAVDARRDGISAQLSTITALLSELGDEVGTGLNPARSADVPASETTSGADIPGEPAADPDDDERQTTGPRPQETVARR